MSKVQAGNTRSDIHKNELFFSVIIPVFNGADLITRTIQSVLCQTFTDFELIVVDDGSTDDTQQVVRRIKDHRLRYIRQDNRGVSAARNLGVVQSHGRYVAFLDSDDEVLPEWLASFASGFKEQGAGVVCVGYVKVIGQGTQPTRTEILPSNLGPLFHNQRVRVHAGTFAVRRDLFEAVGGYAEGLAFGENTELMIRLVSRCKQDGDQVVSVDKPLILYYREPFDISKTHRRYEVQLESIEFILTRHADKLRKDPGWHGRLLATAGVNAAKMEAYDRARHYFLSAMLAHPWNWRHYGRFLLGLVPGLGRKVWSRHNQCGGDS